MYYYNPKTALLLPLHQILLFVSVCDVISGLKRDKTASLGTNVGANNNLTSLQNHSASPFSQGLALTFNRIALQFTLAQLKQISQGNMIINDCK